MSAVGGTPETLAGLGSGFLFRSPSPEDMADGILAHLSRAPGEESLRARCRHYVEERYSWDVVIPQVEALFQEVAGRIAADR